MGGVGPQVADASVLARRKIKRARIEVDAGNAKPGLREAATEVAGAAAHIQDRIAAPTGKQFQQQPGFHAADPAAARCRVPRVVSSRIHGPDSELAVTLHHATHRGERQVSLALGCQRDLMHVMCRSDPSIRTLVCVPRQDAG